jgi:arginine/ornithine transport system substrate-binding protein
MKNARLLKALALVLALTTISTVSNAKDGTLRIAVEGAYPPFSSMDKNGKVQGFDVDFANALCDQIKAKCELIVQDWDGIIPGLLSKKFDAVISSMSITEERKKKVAFSKKYYQSPARFVRKIGSGIEINDKSLAGKTVGIQRGTIHEPYVTEVYKGILTVKLYATQDEAYLDMKAGRIDLLIADAVALSFGLLDTPSGKAYEFIGPELTDAKWFGEGVGIALRKGETELETKFSNGIAALRQNGNYDKIQKKYFVYDIYGK